MDLEETRAAIAALDSRIIGLIAERQQLAARIATVKHHEGLPVHDEEQTRLVLGRVFDAAVEQNVDPVSVQKIFEILIAMNEERQREWSGEGNLP
jgi:chorismate mutase